MFRKILVLVILAAALAISITPALAGDPSQWGIDGDPSQWGVVGDPSQWAA
jgi:hypothetical protein